MFFSPHFHVIVADFAVTRKIASCNMALRDYIAWLKIEGILHADPTYFHIFFLIAASLRRRQSKPLV